MKVCVFTPAYNEGNRAVLLAFAAGIRGADVHDDRRYVPCDVMVIFGLVKRSFAKSWAKGELIRQHRGPVVVVERGYVRRERYWSVGLGGINGRADFRNRNAPVDRFEQLGVALQPWKAGHSNLVLVAGQVPWDVAVQDLDHVAWVRKQIAAVRSTGLTPLFRPHPHAVKRGVDYGVDCEISTASLQEDLARCRLAVTQNSNVGVDAVLAGVPVVATDQGSMVWELSARTVDGLLSDDWWPPNREQWAADIAYAQWSLDEMRDGLAWRHLAL